MKFQTTLGFNLQHRQYRILKRCMIHGLRGIAQKGASCMRDGSCSKRFLEKFSDTTTPTKDAYPLYRP